MANVYNFEEINNAAAEWQKMVRIKLYKRIATLTLKDKHAVRKRMNHKKKDPKYRSLRVSIYASLQTDAGYVSRLNFSFPRHGIFFEHGVGWGRPVRSADARPKPWIVPVLDPAIDELANILARTSADMLGGEIKFTVPGIISKRIKIVEQNG